MVKMDPILPYFLFSATVYLRHGYFQELFPQLFPSHPFFHLFLRSLDMTSFSSSCLFYARALFLNPRSTPSDKLSFVTHSPFLEQFFVIFFVAVPVYIQLPISIARSRFFVIPLRYFHSLSFTLPAVIFSPFRSLIYCSSPHSSLMCLSFLLVSATFL